MYPLVESLKLKDRQLLNLEYHQSRMNSAKSELFGNAGQIDLKNEIHIPLDFKSGIFKIRVLYGQTLKKIEIEPYVFRTIRSLKVVHHESVDYHLKFTDRQVLQELFAMREDCDDIIIVKNGFVSDSFAANLLLFDGEIWVTPTSPLLKGTKRQYLLDHGFINEKEIREVDIKSYQKVGLINAMIDFEEMPLVNIDQIF